MNNPDNKVKQKLINHNIIDNYKKDLNNTKDKFYIPITLDDNVKIKLDNISKIVLKEINTINKYNLRNTGYDEVLVKTDNNNNKHYIYDMFVFDKVLYNDFKLRVNIISYNEQEINNKLIPNPMEVISVPNKFLIKSNNDNNDNNELNIHVNSINIVNSSLVTDQLDLINTTNVDNIKVHLNENLDYKKLNNTSNNYANVETISDNPYIKKAIIRNKWPSLNTKSSLLINVKKKWNEWGIPEGKGDIKYIQSTVSNNPTVNKEFGNKGYYNNMFSKINASGAVSSSDSQPAP